MAKTKQDFTLQLTASEIQILHETCDLWQHNFGCGKKHTRAHALVNICEQWKRLLGVRPRPQEGDSVETA